MLDASPRKKPLKRAKNLGRGGAMGTLGGKEDDIGPSDRQARGTGRLAQDPLASIAIDCVSQPFSRNEGDLARVAFVTLKNGYAHESAAIPPAAGEDPLEIPLGFDGLHECYLV